jgi:VWFA-related protein
VSRRSVLGLLAAAPRIFAWQDAPTFSTAVNVVNVLASVRNKQGEIVRDLTQEDFTIEEEGHPQVIKYFARQTDLPLTLGLLVDTSGSVRRVIDEERNASREFFWQVLRENKDRAFVIHFDFEVELLEDLTSSHKKLDKALDDIGVSEPRFNRRGSQQGGGRSRGQQGGTALYDAVLLASDEVLRKQEGRKAIILLTDGVDQGSRVTLNHAIESAQRADTLVYAIRFVDPAFNGGFARAAPSIGFPGGGRRGRGGLGGPLPPRAAANMQDGKKVLERIAKETGGSYFDVNDKMPLDRIYQRIEEELRSQYSLGYTPDAAGAGYRKLHVSVKPKGLTVQARDGYYPAP